MLRVNTLLGMTAAVSCIFGDALGDLSRLGPPIAALQSELRLLTHCDLRHVARIRAPLDFMDHALRPMRPQFEGTASVAR